MDLSRRTKTFYVVVVVVVVNGTVVNCVDIDAIFVVIVVTFFSRLNCTLKLLVGGANNGNADMILFQDVFST